MEQDKLQLVTLFWCLRDGFRFCQWKPQITSD